MFEVQYHYTGEILREIVDKATEISRGDNLSMSFARNPVAAMFSKTRSLVMAANGFIQHPEVSGFEPEEYDEFIKNPHEFTVEVITPRLNPGYNGTPAQVALNYLKAYLASMEVGQAFAEASKYLQEEYGYFAALSGTEGYASPPFDSLTDFNRGFAKIFGDMRRCPQKVLDAMDAMMPLCIHRLHQSKVDILGSARTMTHMPAFLNNQDFDKFYWPTYFKLCNIAAERGQRMNIFLEGDWTRYYDHLRDLPAGTRLWLEYGNAQEFKDALGDKMILGGLYPLTLLKTATKERCIDKAKELIDVMAPGGNFFFEFDKHTMMMGDINTENYTAMMEYVLDHAKYDNAGQVSIHEKFEDTFTKYSHEYPKFESKYLVTFDDFIKENPPASEEAIPYMRDAFNRINSKAPIQL